MLANFSNASFFLLSSIWYFYGSVLLFVNWLDYLSEDNYLELDYCEGNYESLELADKFLFGLTCVEKCL